MTTQNEQQYAISNSEIDTVCSFLKKLVPGYLPLKIFNEIFRLAVTAATEIVPLRINNGEIEVLLLKRADNDTNWPGMWHTPGCVFRPTDESFQDSIDRVLNKELAGCEFKNPPKMISPIYLSNEFRKAIGVIYYIEVANNKDIGEFFPIDKLPETYIWHQEEFLKMAVAEFKKEKSTTKLTI